MAAVARDPTGEEREEAAAAPVLRPVPEPEAETASEAASDEAAEVAARPWGWVGWLRPPDVWDTPPPTVRQELARAWRGDHLPETGPWRYAELVRAVVSALVNTVLLVLVHVNHSAGRQAVALLLVAAVVLVYAAR